jgi:hypothetical protein
MIDDTITEEVIQTKFLGMPIDDELTWIDQVDSVCTKVSSGIYLVKRHKSRSESYRLWPIIFCFSAICNIVLLCGAVVHRHISNPTLYFRKKPCEF